MNRKMLAIALILPVLGVIWLWQNPVGIFGCHYFGFTVYSGMPFHCVDLKIHVDGSFSINELRSEGRSVAAIIHSTC